MINLSINEFALISNGLIILFMIMMGSTLSFYFNHNGGAQLASKNYLIILLLITVEQLLGWYGFNGAFFLTDKGYIATGAPILYGLKPLLYLYILTLYFSSLKELFNHYNIKLQCMPLIVFAIICVLAVILSLDVSSNMLKSVLIVTSALMLFLFNRSIKTSIASSNNLDFLIKTPLSRFRFTIIISWFLYTLYFSLSSMGVFDFSFTLFYNTLIFVDVIIKLMPYCYIDQCYKSLSNDTIS